MNKTLTLILSGGTFAAAVVCAAVLLSQHSDRQKEKEREAFKRQMLQEEIDRAEKEIARHDEIRKRLKAAETQPQLTGQQMRDYGKQWVERFMTDAGLRRTRHEAAVRARFLALDYDAQRQAVLVADVLTLVGREGLAEEFLLRKQYAFYRDHPELFPPP